MKKFLQLIIIGVLILFINSLSAQEWVEFTASDNTEPVYTILSSNNDSVEFNLKIPGMYSMEIDSFQRISIKSHSVMDSIGYPELPVLSYLVAIPECDSIGISINILDSIKLNDFNIYPAPEYVIDTTDEGYDYYKEEFTYDTATYLNNEFIIDTLAQLTDKGAIRAQNVIRVLINPIQFNPVTEELKAFSEMNIKLDFINPTDSINKNVGIFNEVVGNTLINYESNGLNASVSCGAGLENSGSWKWVTSFPNGYLEDSCDYLIITHQDFYTDTIAKIEIEKLAQHRADFNGFDVVIIKMIDIEEEDTLAGFSNKDKMRNLLSNTYYYGYANSTYDNKLAYVNLFGDANFGFEPEDECVPTHQVGYDVYFTQLTCDTINGNVVYDDIPDLMIGRCSVDDTTQTKNVVHKFLNFKPDELDYKNKMLTVLGYFVSNNNPDYQTQRNALTGIDNLVEDSIKKQLMFPDNYDQDYPVSWDTITYRLDTLKQAYEKGQMFVSYMGHGIVEEWASSPFDFKYSDLNNKHDYILPFILSGACHTGAFQKTGQEEDCMAEQFLCSDSIRGSIGFVGASKKSHHQSLSLPLNYFEALITNRSYILGEAIMEAKIKNQYLLNDYNLFSDPAINIYYENIDSILPDLYIKNSELSILPDYPDHGDTIQIKAILRNYLNFNISNTFYVSCYAVNQVNEDTLWIGNNEINGFNGYFKELNFTWLTETISLFDYSFDININIDTSNSVGELNENNNSTFNNIQFFINQLNFPINNICNKNSNPISFDLYSNYEGEEIVFGSKVLTSSGETISNNQDNTEGYTSIANLNNDNSYQILQINTQSDPIELVAIGDTSWSYQFSNFNKYYIGPIVSDIDNNGLEEIIFIDIIEDNNQFESKYKCLNYDGTNRWNYNINGIKKTLPIICNLGDEFNSILIAYYHGNRFNIYYMKENENNDSIYIYDSLYISNIESLCFDPITTDLEKNDSLNMVIFCEGNGNKNIKIANLINKNLKTKILSDKNYLKPIVSDINNDRKEEIIFAELDSGIWILDYNLDSLSFINEPNLVSNFNILSGDFNNDGINDIACHVIENVNNKHLKIFKYNGNEIFVTPLISTGNSSWVSDIDKDGDIEIIYSSGSNLYYNDIPNTGNSIGWPGQRGNHRNSGVLHQPAYFPSYGDTVFWSNTISLTGDGEIPSNATLIIKPGTVIKADTASELIVYGTLIAKGTENHPIKFTANINTTSKQYWSGITTCNRSTDTLEHCIIENAQYGILFEDDGNYYINNCLIKNNYFGIGTFHSAPVIKENIITENHNGIGCYNNSTAIITDLINEPVQPFKNGIINHPSVGVSNHMSIPYINNGYNDIYNPEDTGLFMKFYHTDPEIKINCRNNYWGTTDTSEIYQYLSPDTCFRIDPILTRSQSSYSKSSNVEYDLLRSANIYFANEEYQNAENKYKELAEDYQNSAEACLAISGLFKCIKNSSGSWNEFEEYINQIRSDTSLPVIYRKTLYGYLNLCKREKQEYSEAISNYESILQNNPTYNDSCYAVINIGNTYLEAGNTKSTYGKLSWLRPKSTKAHIENTIKLLLSLKEDKESPPILNQNNYNFSLNQNIPNPFSNETRIYFTLEEANKVEISVYNIYGQKVKTLINKKLKPGKHFCDWDGKDILGNFASDGIYFYTLKINKKRITKKMIYIRKGGEK
ncbi:MAG: T9SS type A sorting domain-containing protein [Bacteroidales bacterium]|nr:T9SS type A sorting domain-containing protein [Bacteroidales bacterium]